MSEDVKAGEAEAKEMAVNLMAIGSGHAIRAHTDAMHLVASTTNTICRLMDKCQTPEDFANLLQTLRSVPPIGLDAAKPESEGE